jgi:peptide/nickel transport system substrate-binding protein
MAYDAGSGGDPEKGKVWDRENLVGAGPFKLVEYKRDDHQTWTKFDNYWNKPLPYLDGVLIRYIPDPVAARTMMEAGEADYWMGAPARDQKEMIDKGYKKISGWPGLVYSLWPNTSDPTSVWNDVKLRYALDYALDKPAIAKAIGAGLFVPLDQLAPSTEWGYDPKYAVRGYDVAKAKALLKEAGFSTGLKTTLLVNSSATADVDAATAIKGYLDAVGIETEIDLADPGRFYGTVWGTVAPGLSLMWSGMDITNLMTYLRWFSTDPFTNLVYLGHTDEQAAMDKEAVTYPDAAQQKEITERLNKYLNDGAYLVPIFQIPSISIAAKYVHSQQFAQGFVRWQQELIFMEKH